MGNKRIKAPCLCLENEKGIRIEDADIFKKGEYIRCFCNDTMALKDLTENPEEQKKLIEYFFEYKPFLGQYLEEAKKQINFIDIYASYVSLTRRELLEIFVKISEEKGRNTDEPESICSACREELIEVFKDLLKHIK